MTSIRIPDSVTTIGKSAFDGCTGLISIDIPNSVTEIGECAFSYCLSLPSIKIPGSVIRIGSYAFAYCTELASIEIPDSVAEIGKYIFSGCDKLSAESIRRWRAVYQDRSTFAKVPYIEEAFSNYGVHLLYSEEEPDFDSLPPGFL